MEDPHHVSHQHLTSQPTLVQPAVLSLMSATTMLIALMMVAAAETRAHTLFLQIVGVEGAIIA